MTDITNFPKTMYTNLHCWNTTAIECYKRHCICEGCPIVYDLESVSAQNCRMKSAVVALVKKFGIPKVKEDIIE